MAITKKAIKINQRKWVAALRSGKYEQGHHKLKDYNNRYCCLGVAAAVCGVTQLTGFGFLNTNPATQFVMERMGLNSRTQQLLINFNDVSGKNFNWIANWIEENLIGEEK